MNMFGVGYKSSGKFKKKYKCHSMALLEKDNMDDSGKVVLPQSALNDMAILNITYPMMFKIWNPSKPQQFTHCGVIEFTTAEGIIGLPYWMMKQLGVEETGFVEIENVTLPKGKYFRIQPHQKAFLDNANPKIVLEKRLRDYSRLTQGDVIRIEHNKKKYSFNIVEVKPETGNGKAISIVETDVSFEFDKPLDSLEEELTKPQSTTPVTTTQALSPMESGNKTAPKDIPSNNSSNTTTASSPPVFHGTGYTLKGTSKPTSPSSSLVTSPTTLSKAPQQSTSTSSSSSTTKKPVYDSDPDSEDEDEKKNKKFSAFQGKGYSLKG